MLTRASGVGAKLAQRIVLELKDKVANMAAIIQNYKTVEKSMQKALVLAEKSSDETKEAARAAARSIEEDARTNALLIVASAEQEKQEVKSTIISLLAQYDSYKSQYKHLLESQLELLLKKHLQEPQFLSLHLKYLKYLRLIKLYQF